MYRLLENKMAHHDISVLRNLCMKHVLNCKNWIFISTNTIFFGVPSTQFTLIHAYIYIRYTYTNVSSSAHILLTDSQTFVACDVESWWRSKEQNNSVRLFHYVIFVVVVVFAVLSEQFHESCTLKLKHTNTKPKQTQPNPSRVEPSQVEPKRNEPKQHNNNNKKLYNNNNNYRKKENYFKVLSNHLKHSLSDRPTNQPNDGQRNEQSTMK